ncbi:MAG: hypothetical protein HY719_08405, partial [Planctomycetes bacterium]|nr:hypothetical protein [Planctomycetota bacterium]
MARIAVVGNVLKVATLSEREFIDTFEDAFHQALTISEGEITIDLADAQGLGDDAFRLIALTYLTTDRKGKVFRARVPEGLAKAFKHGGLAKQVQVFVATETPLIEFVPDHERTPLAAPSPVAPGLEESTPAGAHEPPPVPEVAAAPPGDAAAPPPPPLP